MPTDHAAPLRPIMLKLAATAAMPREARMHAADAEGAHDIEAVLLRSARALLALEDHISEAEALAKDIRAALLSVIVETGAPPFSTGSHTVSTMETRRVHVTDEALIPPSFMVQPPAKADTQAIGTVLRNGGSVPGATLSNASPSLTIRARKV